MRHRLWTAARWPSARSAPASRPARHRRHRRFGAFRHLRHPHPGSDGSYTYPVADKVNAFGLGTSADDVFTYTVSDGKGGFDTAELRIAVTGTNDAPVAANDSRRGCRRRHHRDGRQRRDLRPGAPTPT